jgi:hypothetical protein
LYQMAHFVSDGVLCIRWHEIIVFVGKGHFSRYLVWPGRH